ncbi:MAG: alpha/beta fold hydrolase [Paracoccus sp. (in: a-proteobacteria)]|uniref:alpha/beta hydrolase n=1 Tax=Paracoccus sp. TaxID=267 RepID=UPI0026E0405F|nr:alpha/beta fold hydrolase [Paracoccus sp. (in: a-proteobacteria)]MDO5621966.1 alpha/beta fold hydrolase [Paracoccus sp. (in: a-proteobacteria)]
MVLILTLALAGCATRPGVELLQPVAVQAPAGARTVTVLTATTRSDPADYGAGRGSAMGFVRYDISIPPGHVPAQIEWPGRTPPDPEKHFVTTAREGLDRRAFAARIRAQGGAGIFVHGYNHSHQEALFRAAQMAADSRIPGDPILFSWPSGARLGDYLGDQDAADSARSALAELLILSAEASPRPVMLMAHSMGGRLTMEALRQLALQGRRDVLDRLEVVLVAPDLDVDMFREQTRIIGRMRQPIAVLAATDDRALIVSSRISAGSRRMGGLDVRDPATTALAAETGVLIVDISAIPADSIGHDRYARLTGILSDLEEHRPQSLMGGVQQTGTFVFDTVGVTLQRMGQAIAE